MKPTKKFRKLAKKPKIVSARGGSSALEMDRRNYSAVQLLQDIAKRRIEPKELTTEQRRSCLMMLMQRDKSISELAALFQVTSGTISNDLKQLRKTIGKDLSGWTSDELIGDISSAAEVIYREAMKEKDFGLAWQVKKDLHEHLRKIGVGEERDNENKLKITIESIGKGYERMKDVVTNALDPRLSGMIVDVPGQSKPKPLGLEVKSQFQPEEELEDEID